ncbi:Glu/Leu/Phe/Val dehydrogenase dimerization domain-containing protein [Brachyspira suanatina]|nr:Glu/Leu/Phe/Val dehydrogenase dimerization domain-containing protein [Brachyspira suanatina]
MRLARGISLKSACAGLDLGGGKTVIMADPKKLKEMSFSGDLTEDL